MLAADGMSGTVPCVSKPFLIQSDTLHISLLVPSLEAVWCFLERQRGIAAADVDDDDNVEAYYATSDEDFDAFDLFDDDDDDDVEVCELTDADIWELASMFGIGQYSPTWWVLSEDEHGDGCRCRPMGLLEVLQYHTTGTLRQDALEAHLAALQEVWDHFWSGDGIVNGSSDQINGACVACLVDGREHLGDVLEEARNLAEELGEALAAFHSHINIGLDRY